MAEARPQATGRGREVRPGSGSAWPRGGTRTPRGLDSSGRFPALLHEGESLAGELVLVLEHPPPDLGRRRKPGKPLTEGLDDEHALVVDLLQPRPGLLPVHAALARRRTVVLGHMDVDHDVLA